MTGNPATPVLLDHGAEGMYLIAHNAGCRNLEGFLETVQYLLGGYYHARLLQDPGWVLPVSMFETVRIAFSVDDTLVHIRPYRNNTMLLTLAYPTAQSYQGACELLDAKLPERVVDMMSGSRFPSKVRSINISADAIEFTSVDLAQTAMEVRTKASLAHWCDLGMELSGADSLIRLADAVKRATDLGNLNEELETPGDDEPQIVATLVYGSELGHVAFCDDPQVDTNDLSEMTLPTATGSQRVETATCLACRSEVVIHVLD